MREMLQKTQDVSAMVKHNPLAHIYIEKQWKSKRCGIEKQDICERLLRKHAQKLKELYDTILLHTV